MSVIVKGIDVPSDCDVCWHPACNLWLQTDVGKRHKDCPISPMPEKHGRLIDVAEFEEMHFKDGIKEKDILYVPFTEVAGIIFNATTIVEAEGD